jgi:hypothetical protein
MSATAATLTNEEYEERKQLLEELRTLIKEEQEQIFRILKRANIEFSENNNGVFFDICIVPKDIFQKMKEFMTLCQKNRESFVEREEEQKRLLELL